MSKQRKRRSAKMPVSAHPAFPAIVGLWFAALLGLGSLVLPAVLFEKLSESSGLSAWLVAAQPPLGTTARVVIALAAAGAGVVIGLAVARQVVAQVVATGAPRGASRESKSSASEEAAAVKRPISAHEELGGDGFDEPGFAAGTWESAHRWDLPAADDSAGSPEPKADWEADFDEPSADEPALAEADDWVVPAAEGPAAEVRPDADEPATGHRELAPSPESAPPVLADLPIVELVDRFARALQRRRDDQAFDDAAEPVVDLTSALASRGGDDTEAEEADLAAADGSYSSLLAMKSPFGTPRQPLSLDNDASEEAEGSASEPVAIFPGRLAEGRGQAPRETERALREALEKLQKMSGIA